MAALSDEEVELQQENANDLRFNAEFEREESTTLLISEVFLYLDHRRQENDEKEEMHDLSEAFIKTLDYSRRMGRFKNRETIRSIRKVFALSKKPFHKYEVAQLGNLCPDNAEEAKSLIPSLQSKIEDAELESLLQEMHSHKNFQ